MQLNSYGGMFMGFKAMTQKRSDAPETKRESPRERHISDDKPEKVIIQLTAAQRIKSKRLTEPNKLEIVVTAFFDQDDVTEAFTHLRQSTPPVEGKFLYDCYTFTFDDHKIILPCKDKKHLVLYVSCITTNIDENNTKNVELKGYGYTKPIPLDNCRIMPTQKEYLSAVEGGDKLETKLAYSVTMTKMDDGPDIPEDKMGGLQDFYQ